MPQPYLPPIRKPTSNPTLQPTSQHAPNLPHTHLLMYFPLHLNLPHTHLLMYFPLHFNLPHTHLLMYFPLHFNLPPTHLLMYFPLHFNLPHTHLLMYFPLHLNLPHTHLLMYFPLHLNLSHTPPQPDFHPLYNSPPTPIPQCTSHICPHLYLILEVFLRQHAAFLGLGDSDLRALLNVLALHVALGLHLLQLVLEVRDHLIALLQL